MMKVLFMGTPEFAVPCLEALLAAGYPVVGAVSQPDKPKGRGHKLIPTPVKACAQAHGIPVFQPETLRDEALLPQLTALEPEVIAVVAYGRILPGYVLKFPKYGCINVHASLLPRYRGAAPIQWSILRGEKTTGVTTMHMAQGLDTGDMILRRAVEIGPEETYGQLHDRLAALGAALLPETLARLEAGTAPREPQDDALACYAPMISKETGHLDWSRSPEEILNQIRGVNPWPMAYSIYQGAPLKVIRATAGGPAQGTPGEILETGRQGIRVACGGGQSLWLEEIQAAGSKRMLAVSYLNGHQIQTGVILV